MSKDGKPRFDEPFDRLTVLSRVEGLTTLGRAEGESSRFHKFWPPAPALDLIRGSPE